MTPRPPVKTLWQRASQIRKTWDPQFFAKHESTTWSQIPNPNINEEVYVSLVFNIENPQDGK